VKNNFGQETRPSLGLLAVAGSGTGSTVVGSNGVIVAGGGANVPTSNLNSEYLP